MKTIIRIALILLTVQFSSCEKDSGTVTTPPLNTVTEYRNSKVFRKYVYNKNILFQFYQYDYNGSLQDTMEFFYTTGRLDSTYSHSYTSGEKYLTKYEYDYDGKLNSFKKLDKHNSSIEFYMRYNEFNEINAMFYVTNYQPYKGVFYMSGTGNLYHYGNNYVASIFNENMENNRYNYNTQLNVLQPFWILDPTVFSPSINLEIEQIQTTQGTNDAIDDPDAVWHIKNDYWTFKYSYYTDGNVKIKTLLDSTGNVLDVYEYEYITF